MEDEVYSVINSTPAGEEEEEWCSCNDLPPWDTAHYMDIYIMTQAWILYKHNCVKISKIKPNNVSGI